ncbi:hypothetical protein [Mesorhizobium sp. M0060]
MKKFLVFAIMLAALAASAPSFAGNCEHNDDTAADGSRCGDRSADSQ